MHAICVDLVFAFFICPAIVNPDPCGIVEAPISPIARSNLIQVAQILQVLVHSKWESFDPKMNDLYSRFDKDCVSSILDAILDESSSSSSSSPQNSATAAFSSAELAESSPSSEPCIDTHHLLQGLNRTVVLVTDGELQIFVNFLRSVLNEGSISPMDKATLQRLLNPLPSYNTPSKTAATTTKTNGEQGSASSNGDHVTPPSGGGGGGAGRGMNNLLTKVNQKVRSKTGTLQRIGSDSLTLNSSIWSSSDDSCDLGATPRQAGLMNGEGESPVGFAVAASLDQVLVIPFSNKNDECIGMLTEMQVLSLQQHQQQQQQQQHHHHHHHHHQKEESGRASLNGSSVCQEGEDAAAAAVNMPVQEKRTRFSLSHDEGSIGNTSDNLEAVSEAASNHSVESSVESENEDEAEQFPIDNLSDMVSANVSGRGSPNVSGRDTPSSQVCVFCFLQINS